MLDDRDHRPETTNESLAAGLRDMARDRGEVDAASAALVAFVIVACLAALFARAVLG